MSLLRGTIVNGIVTAVAVAFLASPSPAQIFDYAVQGVRQGDQLGASISRIGDLDGDGCDDFIVGASSSRGTANEGVATIYSGKSGSVILQLVGVAPPGQCSEFGYAVEGKFDADGDGYSEVIVGAPYDDTGGTDAGRVVVYSPHLTHQLYALVGSAGLKLGTSIRGLNSDLDGDSIDDFIVGAFPSDAAFVYSGATGSLIYSLNGQAGSEYGWSVSAGGNLDGDGTPDFLIGSPIYVDSMGNQTGRVAAFSGKTGNRIWFVDGALLSSFGESIAEPGDLDGDGFSDVVVGARFDTDPHGIATGSVTALSGQTGAQLFKVYGDAYGDDFGFSVRGVSDLDGDGLTDFLVGAISVFSTTRLTAGYARLFSGTGKVLHTFEQHTSDPKSIMQGYGTSIAGADVDGDGRRDLLICNLDFDGTGIAEVWQTAAASWQNYGAGWPGTHGIPNYTALNDPVVGQSLSLALGNSRGATTPGLLALGFTSASIHIKNSGTLLVNPLLWLPLSIPASGLTLSGSIPDDPALYGLDVFSQVLEVDAGASRGIAFTPGLELLLGFP